MNIYSSISIPDSLQNLLTVLKTAPENTRILAGGTDILLELKQGFKPPVELMVDVTEVPEMLQLEERDGQIFIGAAVPLSEIIASPLVKQHAQALYEACKLIRRSPGTKCCHAGRECCPCLTGGRREHCSFMLGCKS